MSSTEIQLKVQVLDQNYKAIQDAKITIESDDLKIKLNCGDAKGYYLTKESLPKGVYHLTVIKKPFGKESRKIMLKHSGQIEVFILLKSGVDFYYRGRVKMPFVPDLERIAIVVPEKATLAKKGSKEATISLSKRVEIAKKRAKTHNLKLEKGGENFLQEGIFVCRFPKNISKKERLEICECCEKEAPNTTFPILKLTEKNAVMLTNELMVKFEDYVDESDIKKMAKEYGLKIKRKISVLGNLYHFTTAQAPTYEILSLINKIAELKGVEFAEPNVYSTVEEDAITPTDFLFPEQWDHQLIQTPDAWQFLRNINVNRTFGNPSVILSVVDSGVDLNHPDFNGNVNNGSSKIYRSFDFSNMVANNNSLSSGHGTSCASAAASLTNNVSAVAGINEGVAGVAGNCRILAIRRGGSEARYADMYLWAGGFDPESSDDDFPDQISPGADVISNSFGFSTGVAISGTMSAVFDKLTDDGRDGKGTLLFFSSGNANSDLDVTFARPWGMYNRCFSVAASTLANDGVAEIKAAYSSFGSVVEFCAPSNDGWAPVIHNPTATYGAFTATPTADPEGDGTVGRPTVQTTLTANENVGNTVVSVNSVAGMVNGQAIMFGAPGSGITEAHLISAINNGTNQVTLNRGLFNNHANGTAVFTSAPDYRSNFGGTSYSTPICAGIAALMLSANPQLTWTQVRDLMRETAVKINPTENNATGRWQDVNGNFSNSAAYNGTPFFSEFYGYGRVDAGAAVREAGWDIDLVTTALNFNDVPAGDTVSRAIRFNVKSLWPTSFSATAFAATSPFELLDTSILLGASSDSSMVREVYFWVTYTGTNAGDTVTMADGITVTVQNTETEQEWTLPVTANVISRPSSAIMLCLDQSGSMDSQSGIGSLKRIDVLRFSANIMIDVLHEGNGLGIVSFDHDPHDVLSFKGPVGPPISPSNPFDQDRTDMKSAINNFSPNLSGLTAIGDGIERALARLNPVTGFDSKSTIVFTDGKETASKYIADVSGQINDRMFAIGLGKAESINPAALNAVTNASDGYMLLADDLGQDSIFKLAKYFLQIQAAVNNEEIVVDPDGTLFGGQVHKIPFVINEADITVDVIAMVPSPSSVEFFLETPNGTIIRPSDSMSTPGLTFSYGSNVVYYRLNLPLPLNVPEKEGTWQAVLVARDSKYVNRMVMSHNNPEYYAEATASKGKQKEVPYSLLVHSYSNLKMETNLSQTHHEPGATVNIGVRLSQYGIPLDTKCSVVAELTMPNKQVQVIALKQTEDGVYESSLTTTLSGVYKFLIKATGRSLKGKSFTREQVKTIAVWQGGNKPFPETPTSTTGGFNKEDLCQLLSCLLSDDNLSRKYKSRLKEGGINIDGMIKCLRKYCSKKPQKLSAGFETLESSKIEKEYGSLIRTYMDSLNKK